MKRLVGVCCVAISTFFISGCEDVAVYLDYGPSLETFELANSEMISESGDGRVFFLDPYEDQGTFQVMWYSDSYQDYSISMEVLGSNGYAPVRVLRDFCGSGLSCDESGIQICEYTPDYEIGCGVDLFDAHRNLKSVDHLIDNAGELLVFRLEICSSSGLYCDQQNIVVEPL